MPQLIFTTGNRQLKKHARGFTLLELMLVLALIAALLVAGLGAYQIQVRNFKVDKTALQMQQWLQAGLAFYTDCGVWPDPAKDPNIIQEMTGLQALTPQACPPLQQPTFKAYMPANSDVNGPFPNSYSIGPGDANGPYANLLQVTTYITAVPNAANRAMAASIAARLPNAYSYVGPAAVVPGRITVVASVGIPGSAGGNVPPNNRGYILNMQIVNSKTQSTIVDPTKIANACPPGMQPTIVNAISKLHSGTMAGGRYGAYDTSYSQQTSSSNNFLTPELDVTGDCDLFHDCNNDNDSQILLITACIPTTTISSATPNASSSTNSNNASQRF